MTAMKKRYKAMKDHKKAGHGSGEVGYYPHELILGYEVCQMKGTHMGVSELKLDKSYQFGLLRIQLLCFWSIR